MKNNLFETIKTRLNKAYNLISLYIFGSYAWGTPTKDSDLDLLLVVESSDKKSYKRSIDGIRALRGLGIVITSHIRELDELMRVMCSNYKNNGLLGMK